MTSQAREKKRRPTVVWQRATPLAIQASRNWKGRSSASQASSTGAKGGFLYTWFNPRGQKGLICTRDNITMARRGQNGWICTRESIVVCEMGGFAHEGWRALIIVDFDVVIIDTLVGLDVPHRPYATSADRQPRRTWPAHGLGKWEVPAGYKFSRQRGRRRR